MLQQVVIKPEIQISPGQGPTSTTHHLDGKLVSRSDQEFVDVGDLSHKLDIAVQVLKHVLSLKMKII